MKSFSKAIQQNRINEVHSFDSINAFLLRGFDLLQAVDHKVKG